MKINDKAIEAACNAFQASWSAKEPVEEAARWPDDYDVDEAAECRRCMAAAIVAAAPIIRAQAINECALRIERFGVEIQMQGTMGRIADLVRKLDEVT